DVDTASYANVRQFLVQSHQLPPADAVRVEELVNYFPYDYSPPTDDAPFAAHVESAGCPWNAQHRLVRIGVKGRELLREKRPQSNLVFLIDVSGSMNEPAKLPLLVHGMKRLARQLGENDRVAIVVYASSQGLALPSTPGTKQQEILAALDRLRAGGSTAGGAGVQLAYQIAADHFVEGGVNRVVLCTDGDFNVGVTSNAELERMAEKRAKETGVFLTVLGFGRGNLNDAMMEKISGKGNGNYYYVDNQSEAEKVLVAEMTGTLVTIAKDVKIQVDFNPAEVAGYRLIGYANRLLNKEDFKDDAKDAGEIGAGHTVTALYEVVPAGEQVETPQVDESKYVSPAALRPDAASTGELLTLKIRYKQPDADEGVELEFPVTDGGQKFAQSSDDFQFAAAVAAFGMLLRDSPYAGDATLAGVREIAESAAKNRDPHGYRAEFVSLVERAEEIRGE
ncbi:MAG: von Willebrand factor type A domain-containing protein, partial [Planctomycetota bacterium]